MLTTLTRNAHVFLIHVSALLWHRSAVPSDASGRGGGGGQGARVAGGAQADRGDEGGGGGGGGRETGARLVARDEHRRVNHKEGWWTGFYLVKHFSRLPM